MKQPVDSFFNRKLENYNREAPASAWDRIDANLSQKKKPFVWLKIAASLLIVALAGFIIYTTSDQPVEQLAEVKKTLPVEKEVIEEAPIKPEIEKIKEVQPQIAIPEGTTEKYANTKKITPKIEKQSVEEPAEIIITPSVMIAENSIDQTNETTVNPIETEIQNTTIVISAEEANAKYLNQQFVADATTETKKSSKIRNLFEKAQDLDPIGEIRQLKNEVLAMNFRNEKKGERNR